MCVSEHFFPNSPFFAKKRGHDFVSFMRAKCHGHPHGLAEFEHGAPLDGATPGEVFVVCISAMCRLDYATQVTDMGAQLINKTLGAADAPVGGQNCQGCAGPPWISPKKIEQCSEARSLGLWALVSGYIRLLKW